MKRERESMTLERQHGEGLSRDVEGNSIFIYFLKNLLQMQLTFIIKNKN